MASKEGSVGNWPSSSVGGETSGSKSLHSSRKEESAFCRMNGRSFQSLKFVDEHEKLRLSSPRKNINSDDNKFHAPRSSFMEPQVGLHTWDTSDDESMFNDTQSEGSAVPSDDSEDSECEISLSFSQLGMEQSLPKSLPCSLSSVEKEGQESPKREDRQAESKDHVPVSQESSCSKSLKHNINSSAKGEKVPEKREEHNIKKRKRVQVNFNNGGKNDKKVRM